MTHVLFTAQELALLTFGTLHGKADWVCSGFSLDGSSITAGEVYVAIKGEALDGHAFLQQAASNGAVAAMVEYIPEGAPLPCLLVRNCAKALEEIGATARRKFAGKAIAITGSVGKTTAKELMLQALSVSGETQASRASYNNWLGVPFTLANLRASTEFGVFEVGMNNPFEITPLVAQIKPDIALITWISEAHIATLGSLTAIAHAKAEIFDGLPQEGIACIPFDASEHDRVKKLAAAKGVKQIYSFGNDAAHTKILNITSGPDYLHIQADILGETITTRLAMGGVHHANNVLAVLLVAKLVTGSAKAAAAALDGFGAISGRGARKELHIFGANAQPILLIDESYNASPTAMIAAIRSLGLESGRRVAVLGDMRELGDFAVQAHIDLAEPLLQSGAELIMLCGPNMRHLADVLEKQNAPVTWAADSSVLLPQVFPLLKPNDHVLIKGSLGSKMKPIVQDLLGRK